MKRQAGFGVIAAIVVLVILATLASAVISLSTTQSITLSQDVLAARAMQTARAGTEWGLYQAFSHASAWNGASCDGATRQSPVTATVSTMEVNGFLATVTCWSSVYNEGELSPGTPKQVRVYQITAVACPEAACPQTDASISRPGYVERRREVVGM